MRDLPTHLPTLWSTLKFYLCNFFPFPLPDGGPPPPPPPQGSKAKHLFRESPIVPEMLSFVWLWSKVSSIYLGRAWLHSRHAAVMCVAPTDNTNGGDRCKLHSAVVLFSRSGVRTKAGWFFFLLWRRTSDFFGFFKNVQCFESSSPLWTSLLHSLLIRKLVIILFKKSEVQFLNWGPCNLAIVLWLDKPWPKRHDRATTTRSPMHTEKPTEKMNRLATTTRSPCMLKTKKNESAHRVTSPALPSPQDLEPNENYMLAYICCCCTGTTSSTHVVFLSVRKLIN